MGKDKTVWILQECGYEYNDEYYEKSGDNYGESHGTPEKVYVDREKANKALLKKEKKAYSEIEIFHYASYGDGVEVMKEDVDRFLKIFNIKNMEELDADQDEDGSWCIRYCEASIPKKTSDEDFLWIKSIVGVDFYELVECKIVE